MKKTVFMKKIVAILVLILLGGVFMTITAPKVNVLAQENKRIITVSGTATVKHSPDIAFLNIGITEAKTDSKLAFEAANEKMNAIIFAVKDSGISDIDIETTQLSLYPNFSYSEKGRVQNGYTASNSIRVTVRKLENAAIILTKAINLGANQNSGIEFALLDSESLYNEALALAVKNAKNKATAIADSIGIKIDLPTEIIENKEYSNVHMARAMTLDSVSNSTPQIEAGAIKIQASVTVIYS